MTDALEWLKVNIVRLNEHYDRKFAEQDAKMFLHDVRLRIREERRNG